ncbi:uncharacterized protein LOC124170318 [Ischnura elegans]|uniref:uncharacterized protein LOC124170318 n=1 Tax=Ischnura elegans TaxID=197161 RepID=UPI001ED8B56A|nr:uncharacterized protein LOC124170318 [Ischnura elegans]
MGSNVTNLAPIRSGEDFPPLADAIGNALRIQGDVDWFNSEAIGPRVPEPIGSRVPEPVSIQRNINNSLANIEGRPSIDALLANAADDCEKGRILLQHARHFLKKGPSELTALLHPSYNIYMQKVDKISAITIGTTPKRLQEQLLLKLFGRDYIGGHSASGQRRGRGGNPAADVETMEAADGRQPKRHVEHHHED